MNSVFMHIELHVWFFLILPMHHEYLINAIICYSIYLDQILRSIMLVISYLLNHTSCLYLGTVALWVTSRVPPLTCTVILFPDLVIFSTRSKFQNWYIMEQLSNNITLLRYNLISLVWFCLKKKLQSFFQRFD